MTSSQGLLLHVNWDATLGQQGIKIAQLFKTTFVQLFKRFKEPIELALKVLDRRLFLSLVQNRLPSFNEADELVLASFFFTKISDE
jgi:hypothetical protein